MTGPRRAPAPPLRLRLRSGTAARRTISYETTTRKPDGGWGTSNVRAGARASVRNDMGLSLHPKVRDLLDLDSPCASDRPSS